MGSVAVARCEPPERNDNPPGRAHHALRIGTDAPGPLLRSLGFKPSDCAAQLRAPSQVKQARGAVTMNVQVQVRIGCRF